ncbi:MAG: O-antigen ligase family protein [Patescibacteria group bacterium]
MKRFDKLIELFFYFFLFLLPWQTRLIIKKGILNGGYWEWGTISLYAIDIVFFILLILNCFTRPNLKNFQFSIFNFQIVKLLVICFLIFILLSCFWAKEKNLSFYWWLRICQGIILFFLVQRINFSFLKAGFSLILAGLIQSFLSFFQFINQSVFPSKWLGIAAQDPSQLGVSVVETVDGRFLRVYGSLSHPNILAGFLVFLIFISFILYSSVKKSWQKYFFLFSASFMSFALFLTFSRAAWLSLIVSLFIFALFLFKKSFKNFRVSFFEFFGLILIVALIFSSLFLKDLIVRVEIKGKLETHSVKERILNIQKGIEIIKENLFFGVGVGNYTFALYKKYPNLSSWNYQPLPNIYLLVLAELGIIGLTLFLLILYFSLLFSVFDYQLLIVPLLILGFFDHWLFSLYFGILLFWLVLGLVWKKCENF